MATSASSSAGSAWVAGVLVGHDGVHSQLNHLHGELWQCIRFAIGKAVFDGACFAPDPDRSRHCQVGYFRFTALITGQVVIRRQLKRRYVLAFFEKLQPCLVGTRGLCLVTPLVTRAAGTWPYLRLMPPAYVKPYVKRQKQRCGRRRGHL